MYAFKNKGNYNIGDIMVSNFTIKEDKIILYLDYSFEFGSFDGNKIRKSINDILDYLKRTRIDIDGKKIVLMLGSTLIATLIYTNGSLKALDVGEKSKDYEPQIVEQIETKQENDIKEEAIEQIDKIEKEEQHEENTSQVENKEQEKIEVKKDTAKPSTSKKSIASENTATKTTQTTNKPQSSPNTGTSNSSSKPESSSPSKAETEKKTRVTIYRSNGTIVQKELEEYLVGVVAAEMPASFNVEALKAQAVIARTYTLNSLSQGKKLTDTVSTQAYIDESQMKSKWGSDYNKYYSKITSAVNATKGQYITYNGKLIDAVYHSTSNGKTEDAENVWGNNIPYLKSVDSSWDKSASSYLKIDNKEFSILMKILGFNIDDNTEISIMSRNSSGRVFEVKIGSNIYTGVQLRNLLGLRSADFDINIEGGKVVIITRGYGHGVGMSQYGANGMANSGYNYKQIITHYYTGVKING